MITSAARSRRPRVTPSPGRKPNGPVRVARNHASLRNCVAWWPLIDQEPWTVNDRYSDEHGTVVGGVTKRGDYLAFDGSTGYVDFGNSSILTGATECSFLLRVRFHSLGTGDAIYRKNAAGQQSFSFQIGDLASDELRMAIKGSAGFLIVDTTATNLTTGVWYDIGFVWEGGNNSLIVVNQAEAATSNAQENNPPSIEGSTEHNCFGAKYNAGSPNSFCHMDLAFAYLSRTALTIQEVRRFFRDPYAPLQSAHPPLIFSAGLTVHDLSFALSIANPSLTQTYALAVADLALSLTFDSPTVDTGAVLSVEDVTFSLSYESPALTQAHNLSVQALNLALSFDTAALTQVHQLQIQDASFSLGIDSPTLDISVILGVDDLAFGLSVDSPTLSEAIVLAVQDVLLSLSLDNIDLTQAHTLVVSDALFSLITDSPTLSYSGTVTAGDNVILVQSEHGLVIVASSDILTKVDSSDTIIKVH